MADYGIPDEHEGFHFKWTATITPERRPEPPFVTCNECLGRGSDEFEDCKKCDGTGKIRDPSFRWEPKPPEDLVEAMRKAWKEYWNKYQNDNFNLE